MIIEEKKIDDEKIAVINYKGSVENMGLLIDELLAWGETNKIEFIGAPFAIYYTSPQAETGEEMVYDVGFQILSEVETTERIQIGEVVAHTVISVVHKGEYEKLPETYKKMVEYSIENNYDIIGSPKEIYYNSPHEVSQSELLTEIQFPVIKM